MNAVGKVAVVAGGGVLAWELVWWQVGKRARRRLYEQAKAAAVLAGKPLLVVGEPDSEYPCGDVTIDLRTTSVCPVYYRVSVEDLSRFPTKRFGAAFVSHVLEAVCDPERAVRELERVADTVVVSYAKPWRLSTLFLVPGHRWLVRRDASRPLGLRFVPWGVACNRPNRYGVA